VPLNFTFGQTINQESMGICQTPVDAMKGYDYIVKKGDAELSLVHFKMMTNDPEHRMPLLGRTIAHKEAVALVEEWINAMEGTCE
jgi:hypothetical protein